MRQAVAAIAVLVSAGCSSATGPGREGEAGWIDLMPGKDLKGWKRVPIDPLAAKAVWSVSGDGKLLLVDGVDAKEMLLYEKEFGDGVFHVEWRFRKQEGAKPVYNGGAYVRTSMDGKAWIQAQVAHQEKPPVVGDLFAAVPGQSARVDVLQKGPDRSRPPGEWNAFDLTCKGKSIALAVNGHVTAEWTDCPMARGHVGLQAEFAFFEVRSLRFKPLP
jgi:hypothetical protein